MTRNSLRRLPALVLGATALLVLQACSTTVSKGVSDDGRSASEVVFPAIQSNNWRPEGTFPNLENLRNVAPGLTKPQLYDLLGAPHFSEGMGPREWDYVFNFRSGSSTTVCQYKVLFDRDQKAQSFYWMPDACAGMLNMAAAPAAVVVAVAPPMPAPKTQLSADALFAFDRSSLQDLLPKGRGELDALAASLRSATVERVTVVGYTDRLGSDNYNQQLSAARANTVRSYLVSAGVPSERISASGRGESDPVVQCRQSNRAALIDCLAPNRRVEIAVQATPAR